jgi:hypothetical protein
VGSTSQYWDVSMVVSNISKTIARTIPIITWKGIAIAIPILFCKCTSIKS